MSMRVMSGNEQSYTFFNRRINLSFLEMANKASKIAVPALALYALSYLPGVEGIHFVSSSLEECMKDCYTRAPTDMLQKCWLNCYYLFVDPNLMAEAAKKMTSM